jgi:DNA-binding FadR family transcriptional regulator
MTISQSLELMEYLSKGKMPPGTRLPAIQDMASMLGISTGKLREQLEVARQLGLLEIRPKTGIRTCDYSFYHTIKPGLLFALALKPELFYTFGMLRNHIEAAFWNEAVQLLQPNDIDSLGQLMQQAWQKLKGYPIQIPHEEHRQLHLTIYSRLDNVFVLGLLEAYWEAYEAVGLNLYADYSYLESVWTYHDRMVQAIHDGDYEAGYEALIEHTGLLHNRPEVGRYRPPTYDEAGIQEK